MKMLLKAMKYLSGAVLAFFAVTFTIYFFNLDMKLVALIEPFLQKHYDAIPRKQSL